MGRIRIEELPDGRVAIAKEQFEMMEATLDRYEGALKAVARKGGVPSLNAARMLALETIANLGEDSMSVMDQVVAKAEEVGAASA